MTQSTTHVHNDDHPGCKALWPWLPSCNRYRLNVNLIAAATDDVRGMPEAERANWLDFLRGWEGRSNGTCAANSSPTAKTGASRI
ncbi:hypothetical protein [Paenarthrobacter sp. YJN-5]|uniref:hypothetical protein n=1 Tax=Paenarthrobacter sp. YJN-5 TaxID=2735316 RepID=UPI0018787486|nr:hypothetical protein [Paenarthrobacter sp. YJN-5]QOT19270.1 hypothetical protein HMI59_21425 [Paenarthrobacter sp. YJN-5]